MSHSLKRVAVLGAGTMGAQIAAHFANTAVPTLLLDLPADGSDRDAVARRAVEGLLKLQPPPLFLPERVKIIEVGNFEDDLPRVSECDWIIEAVIEDLEVKRRLLAQVEEFRRPETLVSTNTSGLPVARVGKGRGEDFQTHWLGTHFFNPPRYMRLLEIVPGPSTSPEVVEKVSSLGDRLLGKGIVVAKDRPNFIGNRIGSFVLMRAVELMLELGLSVEDVDALTGRAIGRPKTGTFRLCDLVGLDVLVHVSDNLYRNLPDDPWRSQFRPPPLIRKMLEKGMLGRKVGGGFYRKEGDEILTLDTESMEYRPRRAPRPASLEWVRREPDTVKRVDALLGSNDEAAAFLWPFIRDTFLYSAQRVPEITEQSFQIDRAMRWGYNWELGPFELWQGLGVEKIARRIQEEEGVSLPDWVQEILRRPEAGFYSEKPAHDLYFDLPRKEYVEIPEDPEKIRLNLLKRQSRLLLSNAGASLLDLGEGVACLEFHSKMNAIGEDIWLLSMRALEEVERNFQGLVIGNQGADFSVGANLMLLLLEAQEGNFDEIDRMVRSFQQMNQSFRRSPKPVVAAPFNRVLGGGAEVCLGCDRVVAAAETYIGLVEVGVGLIPAGGGTKEMLIRHLEGLDTTPQADFFPGVRTAFETIGLARVSSSAEEARRMKLLHSGDGIEIHRERLLHAARRKVLALLWEGYSPPRERDEIPALGAAGLAQLKLGLHLMRRSGRISDHDRLIGTKLAEILCGGDLNRLSRISESYLLDLEREAFLSLCGERKTLERIQHMLKTGKPLRN